MPIETLEEFKEWLERQPQELCTLIALRAALRVFPLYTHPKSSGKPHKTLVLLSARALLTAGVSANFSFAEVKAVAYKAAYAAVRATDIAAYTARSAADETEAAAYAADAVDYTFRFVANVGDIPLQATKAATFTDTKLSIEDLVKAPIWHERGEPRWLATVLSVNKNLLDSGPEWGFWREWYQGFLDGKPLDWELQRRVVTQIDENVWGAEPEAVAEEIERIRATYLVERTPQAERIEFNPESSKFFTVPIEVAKLNLLGSTLTQIEDALEDMLTDPSNGLHDGSHEVRVLRRTITKYGNDPQQIEMGFVGVHKGIARQLHSGELPQSEENLALQDALEEGARAIRATHPEVAENRDILKKQAIQEMSADAAELLEDVKPLLVAISEQGLPDDWEHDIPQLINDATTPLPSGAPPLPGADEATRIFSRASKMKLKYDALVSKGAEVFDSKGMKTARLGLTVGGALSALVTLGLQLFGFI